MADSRQFVLLAVAVLVPAFLILTDRKRWLLAWVCFTLGIDLFNTRIVINLPAARIAGLMLIPQALRSLPVMLRSLAGKALAIQYACLVFAGIVFGFLLPWPDEGFIRAFNQMASGRAIIYLIRTAADIGLAFFIARQVVAWKRPDKVLRYVLAGTTAAALAAAMEFLTKTDWYAVMTGLRKISLEFRMRGLNYEPRGLGLMTAQGMLVASLLFSQRSTWKRGLLIVLNAVGLFLSGSTSGLVALLAGASVFLLMGRRARSMMAGLVLAGALFFVLIFFVLRPNFVSAFQDNVVYRLTTMRFLESPKNAFEELAFRMEIYDGPALLFLAAHPIHLIIGTGPGLISLPATAYIPPSPIYAWLSETGLNSPPTMGGLLEISNAGLIGFFLWLMICLSSLAAFKKLAKAHPSQSQMWQYVGGAFLIGAAVYFVQTSPLSAIWPVFMGLGIGAASLAQTLRLAPLPGQPADIVPDGKDRREIQEGGSMDDLQGIR